MSSAAKGPWVASSSVLCLVIWGCGGGGKPSPGAAEDLTHVYPTNGAHHVPVAGEGCLSSACDPARACRCARPPDFPPDPLWPQAWTSAWTMYRVFAGYQDNPPPYADRDHVITGTSLVPERDYEVSFGSSYYDASYLAPGAKRPGAMMEYYKSRCLPIFPGTNHYTCAFVSLGDAAYFLRFPEPPAEVPDPLAATDLCLFSPLNHAPARDFIAHLPPAPADARRLDDTVLAYSLTTGEPPILFGYAFERLPRAEGPGQPAYQHPQSFYFSGYVDPEHPGAPPDAPIVSQNYQGFAATAPPAELWRRVEERRAREKELRYCNLFPGEGDEGGSRSSRRGHGWHSLRKRSSAP